MKVSSSAVATDYCMQLDQKSQKAELHKSKAYESKSRTDSTCRFSYNTLNIKGLKNKVEEDVQEDEKYVGFQATYVSSETVQVGTTTTSTREIEFNALCLKDDRKLKTISESAAKDVIYYQGPEACSVFDLDDVFGPIFKFTGAIEIVAGLALTFVGSKFIILTFGFLVFIAVTTILFFLCYNFNMIKGANEGKAGPYIAFLIGCSIVGGIAAYGLAKFAKRYIVAVLSAFVGCAVVYVVTAPIVDNDVIRAILMAVVAIAGVHFGRKFNKQIKSSGTAIIGSVFLMHGISAYAGGFPPLFDMAKTATEDGDITTKDLADKVDAGFIGYIVGMIFFSVIGSYVQLKYVTEDEEGEDGYMNKEFS